mmetsp:Transcript_26866/g.95874  ORF Transcript_26866/g.95874 Transcript_26866/m.95874 type:complete len:278 (-) Transcript_26866:408-1241(-)
MATPDAVASMFQLRSRSTRCVFRTIHMATATPPVGEAPGLGRPPPSFSPKPPRMLPFMLRASKRVFWLTAAMRMPVSASSKSAVSSLRVRRRQDSSPRKRAMDRIASVSMSFPDRSSSTRQTPGAHTASRTAAMPTSVKRLSRRIKTSRPGSVGTICARDEAIASPIDRCDKSIVPDSTKARPSSAEKYAPAFSSSSDSDRTTKQSVGLFRWYLMRTNEGSGKMPSVSKPATARANACLGESQRTSNSPPSRSASLCRVSSSTSPETPRLRRRSTSR